MVTRRTLLLSAALTTACSRTLAPRYQGWLFVSSHAEKGIVVADLAEFRRVLTIPMGEGPADIILTPAGPLALLPDARALARIDARRLSVQNRIQLPGRPVAAASIGAGNLLAVLLDQPASLATVDVASGRIVTRAALPPGKSTPALAASADAIAVATGSRIIRFTPSSPSPTGETDIATNTGTLLYRSDGRALLVAAPETREIVSLDAASGALLTRMPVAVSPRHICVSPDGGQMFISGPGPDAVVVGFPYQNQIDQTISAGHEPGALAMQEKQNVLLVANPSTGNVTILDVETRRLAATVAVGGNPQHLLVTPGGEYALAVSGDSGDVSVIRLLTVLDRKLRTKPVFTVFPTGRDTRAAVIVPATT